MSLKSPSRRQFIKKSGLSAAVTSFVLPAGFACGSDDDEPFEPVLDWESKASALEKSANCCWTAASEPGADSDNAGRAPNHAPVVGTTADGDLKVWLASGHPMTEAHWITSMYVKDQRGVVIWYVNFGEERILPSQVATTPQWMEETPAILIRPPSGTTLVKAYAYCNLHQNWTSANTPV